MHAQDTAAGTSFIFVGDERDVLKRIKGELLTHVHDFKTAGSRQ